MRGALSVLLGITAASSFVSPISAQTQGAHQHAIPRLGTVEFRVDCNPTAQAEFNTAMALYHSFAWPQAVAAFTAVTRTDPACGMAHWGLALSILENPFGWPALFNRYRAIAGAMAAARAAGDDKRARALAAELVKLGAESDTPRDGLRQAKEIAGG